MSNFVENPNLPEGKVSLVVAGEMPAFLQDYLIKQNIKIMTCENNSFIDPSVKSHADMSVVHLGRNRVVVDSSQENLKHLLEFEGFEVISTSSKISGKYPDDVKLNVALFGDKAVGAFKHTDLNLLSYIDIFQKFDVKQGYAKCSILPITENAIITDDKSIYKSLKNTVDTLFINKGDIVLDGHNYGFIGGASTKISRNEILFFGDIKKHQDADIILSFLKKHNHKAVYFKGYPLYDIGGLVTLLET